MDSNQNRLDDLMTYEELESIVKAIAAYNEGYLEFDVNYLKYTGQLTMQVRRSGDTIGIQIIGVEGDEEYDQ